MERRVSLITLAVDDMERAAAFYEALGWRREETPDGVVAFDLAGQTLGLYPREDMARDMRIPPDELRGAGVTLSHNVRARDEVAPLYEAALAAGATGLRAPGDVFWGGHAACFRDPDGHAWEIAWNPHSPLGPNGEFRWSGWR